MTPEETIRKIAEIASTVAWQAGVGGMELAGQFVSVLATHPEKIEAFLSGNLSVVDDDDLLHAERGCLSFRSENGNLTTPAELRAIKQQPDH